MKIVLKEGEIIMIDSKHHCRTFTLKEGVIEEVLPKKAIQIDDDIWNCAQCGCSWKTELGASNCMHGDKYD